MKLIRLLLADDHLLVLDLLKHLLEERYSVVGTASDGEELIASAIRLKPDIVIECTGAAALLEQALNAGAPNCIVCLVGIGGARGRATLDPAQLK